MISKDGKFITNIGVRGLKDANKKDVYMNINIKELLKWENSGYESLKPAVMEKLKKAKRLEAYISNEGTRPSGARQTAYYINICEDSIKNTDIWSICWWVGAVGTGLCNGQWKISRGEPFTHEDLVSTYYTDETGKRIPPPIFTSATRFK